TEFHAADFGVLNVSLAVQRGVAPIAVDLGLARQHAVSAVGRGRVEKFGEIADADILELQRPMEGRERRILRIDRTAFALERDGLFACSRHMHRGVNRESSVRGEVLEPDVDVIVESGCAALALVKQRNLTILDDKVAKRELLLR